MTNPLAAFLAAWMFLTRIPVRTKALSEADFEAAPAFYPLVGMLIGMIGALAFLTGRMIGGGFIAAIFACAATLLATGAFHEDGLADLFDGLGASTPERMMEIMRDSRLGTFGAAALFLALGLKVAALATMPPVLALAALPVAHGLSRLSAVVVIATSTYARPEGIAKPVAAGVAHSALIVAALSGVGALVAFGFFAGMGGTVCVLVGLCMGHLATRLLFEPKLGGYTGDCLGAVQQLSEIGFYLGLLAWL